ADLRRSVPELRVASTGSHTGAPDTSQGAPANKAATPAAAPAPPANNASAGNSTTFRPESAGVIALFGKWFSLEGARRQLADATKQTDGLSQDLEKIRGDVTAQARTLAGQNLDSASTDPAQLMQSKLQFQQAATRFRQLSTLLVPIGEQGITVENA